MNQNKQFDAIVVGMPVSGGWAAKELCDKGLETLVLERGRMVEHIEDYPTMHNDPWNQPYKGQLSVEEKKQQHIQTRVGWAPQADNKYFFVNDLDHPYAEKKRFDWIRGYHVRGRSLTWGRQSYRLSDIDFEANKRENIDVGWPVRYADISPWYDKIEEYFGVSGQNLGLKQLPDVKFQPPMALNCVEEDFQRKTFEKFEDGRLITIGRTANITAPTFEFEGRGVCQNKNRCSMGCPFGGHFSSNSVALPAAERTGNMTLRPNSIVHEILYDATTKKATGVRVIDAETNEKTEFKAKVIFLCASAMASVRILLQSKSEHFPNGLRNNSDALGRGIMDHHYKLDATAKADGFLNKYYKGRRANGCYIPRFVKLDKKTKREGYLRDFGYQGTANRGDWSESVAEIRYGKALKDELLKPGSWQIGVTGFGEFLPYDDNRVTLSETKKDKWGLPRLEFDMEFKENAYNIRKDIKTEIVSMFKTVGFMGVQPYEESSGPSLGIYEMGGARMGHNAKTSMVNKKNQLHAVPNVYVTDGAFMSSTSCVNPSLTYMAFTARAANNAAEQLKKGHFA